MTIAYRTGLTALVTPAGTSITFTGIAAPIAVNDYLVVAIASGSALVTPPAGWTQVRSALTDTNPCRLWVFAKFATSADLAAGTAAFTFGTSTTAVGVVLAYSGVNGTHPQHEPGAVRVSTVTGTFLTANDPGATTISGCEFIHIYSNQSGAGNADDMKDNTNNGPARVAVPGGPFNIGTFSFTQAHFGTFGPGFALSVLTGTSTTDTGMWETYTMVLEPGPPPVTPSGWSIGSLRIK